jgi:pilus assembly protein Flp/PilA
MKNFKQILSNLLKDESGQDLIEYALVAAMVAAIAVVVVPQFTTTVTGVFTNVGTKITNAT